MGNGSVRIDILRIRASLPIVLSTDGLVTRGPRACILVQMVRMDEESSSEDYHSVYSSKIWGNASGNQAMEARANLQLAIM
ncbi:hypothetical protein B0I72DRAFT_161243 [Yarrowia lipolytica]|uniref:glucan endo-1,3-beta-D-glucosidase n=2 Tax=Yarrowia lipolytica TaxID=4952 RepID=Q6CG68_YARLI|nr:YALI0B00418p [Yarrowia lipolytica CLIB122]AOW00994.1 hypothetical protein YALI1_B00419g [Yarrowia lipolytica]KAB8280109.1 hypothetical protein BKA91DRAFT_164568 [Yarrowia lipolytica]KAE8169097.1 hypothetical protein BKA90DRAFT_90591 [Yarrowia lipolytica]RDW23455.1 hypothetical protein B0I71DRAFT_168797 [Yarrowia lipolytica]RDW29804.1 hypothetical protein B0I72DRAFT_161243 [Yarrowia lipolytica]|eukprot:XP_500344.1 YALI0B00418p [Yarrowia lipolytica CLIB122]